ncbi:MAG: CAP domain-containing protein [Rhodobacter sp.]|nr:CAP domain-containing protein [Rhodobacter sp.]MCY4168813.1 CAP domain-containing protein [Rhodobacter sp.]MCY4241569.1 CAP domain-containing protein [Rhodobacter sp.]
MLRAVAMLVSAIFLLSACETGQVTVPDSPPGTRADGTPLPRIYRISGEDKPKVLFRMVDSVNALRKAAGARPVTLDAGLNSAAATHSRDMALQNRPWHFGSDGSSPMERVWRAGYRQTVLGEIISETFETELETLVAWMNREDTRSVIVDPQAEHMGFSWYQQPGGKLWWTLLMGGGPEPVKPAQNPAVLHQG